MYILSIGGARLIFVSVIRSRMGDLESDRPGLCSKAFFPLYCVESNTDGNKDSLRNGSCDVGIDRLCCGSPVCDVSLMILVTVAVSIIGSSSGD